MGDGTVKGPAWLVIAVLAGALMSIFGMVIGAWWVVFLAGMLIGAFLLPSRLAVPAGGLAGLLGWGLILTIDQVRFGLGPTAGSLAAIMGFTGLGAIPLILTCVVGLLLGLTGAWLASAIRRLAWPATR